MSIIDGFKLHHRLFGLYGVFLIARTRLLGKPVDIEVQAEGLRHPISLRLRTTDVSVFEEIIVNGEYSIDPPQPPRVIVDAGANIGLTSIYFANRFPQARILSIEPERANFEMLRRNTRAYPNVVPILGALWRENMPLQLSDPGTGSWGFQTRERRDGEGGDGSVPGLTIDLLMQTYGCDAIDVLKVDIEGAEKEVFESPSAWIDRVGLIMVELHDRTKDGCSRSVYLATRDFKLNWTKGETTVFVRDGHDPRRSATPAPRQPRDVRLNPGRSPQRSRIISAAPSLSHSGLP